mmetsp:Transcript_17575/g.66428  ORF Transcript_17575/g.66428 Transcript_17575/m.66428 type:complete len:227 (+) Transcript_17575:933-1613(+)
MTGKTTLRPLIGRRRSPVARRMPSRRPWLRRPRPPSPPPALGAAPPRTGSRRRTRRLPWPRPRGCAAWRCASAQAASTPCAASSLTKWWTGPRASRRSSPYSASSRSSGRSTTSRATRGCCRPSAWTWGRSSRTSWGPSTPSLSWSCCPCTAPRSFRASSALAGAAPSWSPPPSSAWASGCCWLPSRSSSAPPWSSSSTPPRPSPSQSSSSSPSGSSSPSRRSSCL